MRNVRPSLKYCLIRKVLTVTSTPRGGDGLVASLDLDGAVAAGGG